MHNLFSPFFFFLSSSDLLELLYQELFTTILNANIVKITFISLNIQILMSK